MKMRRAYQARCAATFAEQKSCWFNCIPIEVSNKILSFMKESSQRRWPRVQKHQECENHGRKDGSVGSTAVSPDMNSTRHIILGPKIPVRSMVSTLSVLPASPQWQTQAQGRIRTLQIHSQSIISFLKWSQGDDSIPNKATSAQLVATSV